VSEPAKNPRGTLCAPHDPDVVRMRGRARVLLRAFNSSSEGDDDERCRILGDLLGRVGSGVIIEPPFYCDFGKNIRLGDHVFFNFNCVVLDPGEVVVGNNVLIGPGVQLYTTTHPLEFIERRRWEEHTKPISIGDDVWIGGGTVICQGVTIGRRAVIGAGSVVTKDVPEGVLAVGNPCRVLRTIIGPG